MSLRFIAAISVSLFAVSPSVAAPRAEEAKRYAADLKSKDAKVRRTALVELGKLGAAQRRLTEPYTADIVAALKDADPGVRAEAARTVARIDPKDKKEAITMIADLLKGEKSELAREGQETGLGELGATADEDQLKRVAREALLAARKKSQSKREQKVIQAALRLISGKK